MRSRGGPRHRVGVVAAAACLCGLFAIQNASADSGDRTWPEIEIAYQKFVLANGLTLIVHEDHKAPLVAVNVTYKVGSRDERPGRTGFAHLFEHLLFNGSEHYNDEFFKPLQAVGATGLNGNTTPDRTNYFETVPVNALDLTLWLESDRMGHLLGAIDPKKLDEQRGVVQNEKRQGENNPYGKLPEITASSAYPPGHPYSWTTIGSMEDLNAATLEDVKEWFNAWYGPSNAVLVVAGDVDTEEVKKKVEHYFGDIPPGPAVKRLERWVAPLQGEKRLVLEESVPQTMLSMTWNVPPGTTREYQLLGLAAGVLEYNGNSGRLYERLVVKDQSVTRVGTELAAGDLGSQFQISAFVKPGGDVAAVERAIDEELARFVKNGPTAEELEFRKIGTYAAAVRQESLGTKASVLAYGERSTGSAAHYRNTLRWTREATPVDVQRVARQWLADGVFVLEMRPRAKYEAAGPGADRSGLPKVGALPSLALPPLQRATLANGLKVILAERHSLPVVQLSLIVDAGTAADSPQTAGTARLAALMLTKGTASRDEKALAVRRQRLGAYLGANAQLDVSTLSLNALKINLAPSLELFSEVLLHPSFPEKEFQQLKGQTLAGLEQQKTSPEAIAGQVLPKLVYGAGHAYAIPFSGLGSKASVSALTAEELRAFHQRWVRPDNATLLVVGDTTLAQITPLLEKALKGWRSPTEPLPRKRLDPVTLPAHASVYLVDSPGAEQSVVIAAQPAPAKSDPDSSALQVANGVLGGGFTSRLNLNLREDKHWAYGAGSQWQGNQGPGLFSAEVSVQTDKTAEAMQEIAKELTEFLSTHPAADDELKAAKDNLALRLSGQAETLQGVAGFFGSIVTYGLPERYWNDLIVEVDALTPQQVQAAARRLIHPESLTWIVVGDLSKIESPVRALNFGNVHVLDADGHVVR